MTERGLTEDDRSNNRETYKVYMTLAGEIYLLFCHMATEEVHNPLRNLSTVNL